MSQTLVTCYVNPDLDGVASAIAYAEFLQKTGIDAVAGFIGKPHDEVQWVVSRCNVPFPQTLSNAEGYQKVILVDASDLNGLEGKVSPDKVVEIIDHRKVHEAEKFPQAKAQIELVGAAATLVAERFMQQKLEITKKSAILLYSAIVSNTLHFQSSVTTDRDRVAAAWANKTAQLPDTFWKEQFVAKSDLGGEKLGARIVGDLAHFQFGGTKVGIAQIEIIGVGDLLHNREAEIVTILQELQISEHFDYLFLNAVELEDAKTYFLSSHPETQILLTKVFGVTFEGCTSVIPKCMLRKEIAPLLRTALQK